MHWLIELVENWQWSSAYAHLRPADERHWLAIPSAVSKAQRAQEQTEEKDLTLFHSSFPLNSGKMTSWNRLGSSEWQWLI